MPDDPTPLATILTEHICAWGPITFAKYMDACLYDPRYGYYTRADQSPRRDYFTSVDASPIFGQLLARQFQEMWVQLGRPAEFLLVEPGAGTGKLAAQILDFTTESLPEFYSAVQLRCRGALCSAPGRGRCWPARKAPDRQPFCDGVRHACGNPLRLHIFK